MFLTTLKSSFAALVMVMATPALSQDYPSEPVHLVLPYNPGGIIDTVGRTMAQGLSSVIGQTVVADNKPGAGGILGTDSVVRSDADGYNILLMDPAIITLPSLQDNVPYDPLADLVPISVISSSPLVLVVSPELPVTTMEEFLAYAKGNPGTLNFASAGIGTTPHLAGELFLERAGIEATHIPYNGIGPSFVDLMAGKVQFSFSSIAGALPFTADNRLVAIATTGQERNSAYPDVPTVQEAGIPDFNVDLWLAVFAPAETEQGVLDKLNTSINTVLESEETGAALAKLGLTTRGTSIEDARAFLEQEFNRWKAVIDGAGIRT